MTNLRPSYDRSVSKTHQIVDIHPATTLDSGSTEGSQSPLPIRLEIGLDGLKDQYDQSDNSVFLLRHRLRGQQQI